ncbi:Uncharacterised protein [uncultured archaeon]|nr:Uncharacterised protein [uncultured archaeon]
MPNETCCKPFDSAKWDQKEILWENKPFIKDHVRSLFHIPLNFGQVVTRNMKKIEDSGQKSDDSIMLTDENSLWGADVYVSIDKEIPGAKIEKISGTFLTKVFEGPFGSMRKWIKEMQDYAKSKGKTPKRLLFYYTTCPKCAKKYGKNYVVILAET